MPKPKLAFLRLKAPARLCHKTSRELETTLAYINSIHAAVFDGGQNVFVDMSECHSISAVGCLMLAAEVDRCLTHRPASINGRDPVDPRARGALAKFGFHSDFGFRRPKASRSRHPVFKITARTRRPAGLGPVLAQYSAMTDRRFGDAKFENEVHCALHEALVNISRHALDPKIGDVKEGPCPWWMAAIVEPNLATYIVLDHGHGIPAVAPRKMGPALPGQSLEGRVGIPDLGDV